MEVLRNVYGIIIHIVSVGGEKERSLVHDLLLSSIVLHF